MDPKEASLKKIAGHINEYDYAKLIGGEVNLGSQSDKKDVVDSYHGTHSVKSGKKWQIFLYSRSRLESDAIFQGIGNTAGCLVDCLDSLPEDREQREMSKDHYKNQLKAPMIRLAQELKDEKIMRAFFQTAAFKAGQVDYLAILDPSINQTRAKIRDKKFHIFDAGECVDRICESVLVDNSRARGRGQTDAQKVVFKIPKADSDSYLNLGEIEIRTDAQNYRRAKMWLEAARTLDFLQRKIGNAARLTPQLTVYGKAINRKIVRP